jgi:hypothetical protein
MKEIINTSGNLRETVGLIIDVVLREKGKQFFVPECLTKHSGNKVMICKALYYYVKNNVKYKPDTYLTEEVRTPQRTIDDRMTGVDCEDYSIYIACVLLKLGIRPTLRIVGDKTGYKHIYVVVKDQADTIVIDCCMDDFNQEIPHTLRLDVPIKKGAETTVPKVGKYMIQRLSGVESLEKSKQEILAYEGKGGKGKEFGRDKGILTQFFTPEWVVKKMWQLCVHYGFTGGNVLEPSCGTGRFMYYAPNDLKIDFTAFEREELLANMAQQLVPTAKVYNNYFETAFMEKKGAFYHPIGGNSKGDKTWLPPMDLVIGNPPYGKRKNLYSGQFKIKGMNQIEQFFIIQGMKTLKKDGLMCYITAANFAMTYDKYFKTKTQLNELADFVDGYRLPSVFKNTDVPTDILIFRRK